MKTPRFWLAFFLFFFPALAFAHPPSEITLTYDLATAVLHVKMAHVTNDTNNHYIRKISVFRNDEKEPVNFHYSKQTSAQGMEVDLAFDIKPGDVLKIEAFCSKGGIGRATITIPQEKAILPLEQKKK
jgi:DNA/RNA endonuclease YhcR with UshA esterase domain